MTDDVVRGASPEEEGIPELEDQPARKILAGDTGEGLMAPRDYPIAVEDFGVTAAEESRGESLARRVAREQPEVDPLANRREDLAGRLVQPDQGALVIDDSADEVASMVGDGAGLSAEEAAIRVEDDPGGMTDGWPGYLDDDAG